MPQSLPGYRIYLSFSNASLFFLTTLYSFTPFFFSTFFCLLPHLLPTIYLFHLLPFTPASVSAPCLISPRLHHIYSSFVFSSFSLCSPCHCHNHLTPAAFFLLFLIAGKISNRSYNSFLANYSYIFHFHSCLYIIYIFLSILPHIRPYSCLSSSLLSCILSTSFWLLHNATFLFTE